MRTPCTLRHTAVALQASRRLRVCNASEDRPLCLKSRPVYFVSPPPPGAESPSLRRWLRSCYTQNGDPAHSIPITGRYVAV